MTSAGFEPAPIKTTALTWLLRPLGQDVFKHKQWCSWKSWSLQYMIAANYFICSLSATFNFRFSLFTYARPCPARLGHLGRHPLWARLVGHTVLPSRSLRWASHSSAILAHDHGGPKATATTALTLPVRHDSPQSSSHY